MASTHVSNDPNVTLLPRLRSAKNKPRTQDDVRWVKAEALVVYLHMWSEDRGALRYDSTKSSKCYLLHVFWTPDREDALRIEVMLRGDGRQDTIRALTTIPRPSGTVEMCFFDALFNVDIKFYRDGNTLVCVSC